MFDVVVLTLEDSACGSSCGGCGGGDACSTRPRTPVLHLIDALTAAGARTEAVTAHDDSGIDDVLARFDAPPDADGLRRPDPDTKTRLVVAIADDAQLRHVVHRMVRRYAPPPSRRPGDLPSNRTVPDLPPLGVLLLDKSDTTAYATRLGLPLAPADVARAVLGDRVRRLDLMRNDGGTVTIDGALFGAVDGAGQALAWKGRVEVDDHVLTDGDDPVLACAVAVADGYAKVDDIDLVDAPNPADGLVDVGIAVPVVVKRAFGRDTLRIEVRRVRGRAVSVTPHPDNVTGLPYVEDGVTGELAPSRKRSWWTEPAAWAVYTA
ncbi:hypothetical protein [Hamadaea tsunoensis]|uniref:hypothetical protein n=1 Tax=Hamadaea tsunoensis TaxID=53368 RepID=UPI0004081AE0|nr:hypothetical protein [Hamadaea tsunoensis]